MKKIIMAMILIVLSTYTFTKEDDLVVLTAASLTEVMDKLKSEYKSADINPSYAGSQTLAFQIKQGVDADLFMSANKDYIFKLKNEGYLTDENKFAENKLVIIASKNSDIYTFEDFIEKDYDLGTANLSVPVGNYTDKMLKNIEKDYEGSRDKIYSRTVSESLDVKDLTMKVEIDAVDLAIVYFTDVNKDKVRVIEIPSKYNLISEYYLGMVKDSGNKSETKEFIDYILKGDGKDVLKDFGFVVE